MSTRQVRYFIKPFIAGILALTQLLPWQFARASSVSQTTKTISYIYHYDDNGNLIEADKNEVTQYQYNYNSLNQLVSVTDAVNNKTYDYQYYADGRRAAKVDETVGQAIDFYYGQNGKLLNEALTIDQVQTKISSYFAGARFIKDLQHSNDSQLTQALRVRHNHPASIALKNGVSQTTSYHIDDYGQLANSNNEGNASNQDGFDFDTNPHLFGAGYHDFETGLNYQGARYYNPEAQRFVAQDSFDLLNRYNYANGNPVMNYDPSGHYSIKDFGHDLKKYTWGESTGQHVGFVLSLALAPVGGIGYGVVGGAMIGGIATAASVGIDDHFDHWKRDLISIGINAGIGGALGGAIHIGTGASRMSGLGGRGSTFAEDAVRQFTFDKEPLFQLTHGGGMKVNRQTINKLSTAALKYRAELTEEEYILVMRKIDTKTAEAKLMEEFSKLKEARSLGPEQQTDLRICFFVKNKDKFTNMQGYLNNEEAISNSLPSGGEEQIVHGDLYGAFDIIINKILAPSDHVIPA
ncbi:RHS repeat domain-containing protein [Facilibium subflavum]|uniref:RHS repeat domain-containing protein n=1 Tax=Facilibium subflavum TaxID=2219058 RepID=UPI000E64CD92|nr:RHS repeat-associated core domain-containing protein [Facilibium subflavum]